jgi:hypothetical protein
MKEWASVFIDNHLDAIVTFVLTSIVTFIGGYYSGGYVVKSQRKREDETLKKDQETVLVALKGLVEKEKKTFYSTHVIASVAHLPEDRVRFVCGGHRDITRSRKDKETWRLTEMRDDEDDRPENYGKYVFGGA